ncbi:MAG: complex I NDUFA9 subunit family protein [Hyphomonas sp.]|uniref:complex I NDUFA9 subunit family protein n=1 Tax=Hyphomonas sp. TaxID=87 RepID=UPI0017B8428F|nr:complex I NDUFA9 subunit family protein [Hyphomonas sp.]MBU3920856.1 complex I NDUFA9 subunit family protein [Alphaproteobacteria bacterium]MBA3068571.1 complex I NDUFA9 subunit family protein [Hyphomonas sp.]MBU4061890.1 complex I NDUFA9 subunit family protein [Alphaproteobacteria bacterium]MBU4166045.1 complex I NDUFA9 subunit family protein [Alphaproteobacteria bacterium]MBU4567704.1 complex I NDUFA9 subunit family protein [Alphaproteobacteria bacterium]
MSKGLVTVFGGSGFIGRYTARTLVEQGWRVRVACRRVHTAIDVRLAGPPGWVDIVQANVRDRASIDRALDGADAVVNLVGILFESGKQTFQGAHADGAALIAEAAAAKGITRFIQVSAIGASAASKSPYAKSKAAGEAAVRKAIPTATILRPSIVFGPEDDFFNRFAAMARSALLLPAIGGGKTRFQPVYAGNVAEAITAAAGSEAAEGKTYELGGPAVYTFNELFDVILKIIDEKRFKIGLPFFIVRPLGYIAGAVWRYLPPFSWGMLGRPPLTGSQVELLKDDNVVAEGALTLADLGVTTLESVEAIVPRYLWRFRTYGEFHKPSEA